MTEQQKYRNKPKWPDLPKVNGPVVISHEQETLLKEKLLLDIQSNAAWVEQKLMSYDVNALRIVSLVNLAWKENWKPELLTKDSLLDSLLIFAESYFSEKWTIWEKNYPFYPENWSVKFSNRTDFSEWNLWLDRTVLLWITEKENKQQMQSYIDLVNILYTSKNSVSNFNNAFNYVLNMQDLNQRNIFLDFLLSNINSINYQSTEYIPSQIKEYILSRGCTISPKEVIFWSHKFLSSLKEANHFYTWFLPLTDKSHLEHHSYTSKQKAIDFIRKSHGELKNKIDTKEGILAYISILSLYLTIKIKDLEFNYYSNHKNDDKLNDFQSSIATMQWWKNFLSKLKSSISNMSLSEIASEIKNDNYISNVIVNEIEKL